MKPNSRLILDVIDSPIGRCAVTLRGGRVARIELGRTPGLKVDRARLPEVRRWLRAWFAGRTVKPPLDLSPETPFHRRVYETVRRIPRGRTLTYGEVARRIGRPRAARAVGQALGRNPICLLIPCHRVVASRGLGGFSAPQGLAIKRRLLAMEGVSIA
ncbi:MAG: methylated-DNA--[protein]-cysteine S-methyltransferase [Planctomycetes bacterium]|nr:methylated-DNA--[protein]-cysteine S-methyltransferase [Planctomycetota bacterium]